MSNLPAAVLAQVQQADAEWNSMYGDAKVVNAPDPDSMMAGLENVQVPEQAPVAQPVQVEPAQQEQPQPPTPAQPQAETPQADPWEQRYKVLKGKYDAEVPRLQTQLNQSQLSIETLTRQVEELAQKQRQVEREKQLKLSPEEESAFGKDLLDVTRKIAATEADARNRELEEKLAQMQASVQTVSQSAEQQAQERFLQRVNSAVPDWKEIDARTDWLTWLGQHDPLLGSVRQTVLDQAAKARDAGRVAALFNAFKATLPAPQQPAAEAPNTVQQQVAPRSQASTPTQPTPTKRIYSDSDIRELFSANRRGEFTREQWATISTELDMAVAEGRVR